MGILSNLKIRTKVLLALLPLALMVILAALYASIEMERIDSWYRNLIDQDVLTWQSLTNARALNNRFGQLLYEEIAERDVDRMLRLDAELDQTVTEYHAATEEAKRGSPELAARVEASQALFDQLVVDSRPIRAASLRNDNDRAMQLASGTFRPEMLRHRRELQALNNESHTAADRQFSLLTARTHRTVVVTWIVIALGLGISFSIALAIVQVEVVRVVMWFRSRILDVAQGRLDLPILNLDRPNEIGEMSRALQTLQVVSRERQLDAWVKAELASTTGQLQQAEDFPTFGALLLTRISNSVDMVYAAFYLADESHTRFTRVAAFASNVAAEPREFPTGVGLVGQSCHRKAHPANHHECHGDPGHFRGSRPRNPRRTALYPRHRPGSRAGGDRTGNRHARHGAPPGSPRRLAADDSPEYPHPRQQTRLATATRTNTGAGGGSGNRQTHCRSRQPVPNPIFWPI